MNVKNDDIINTESDLVEGSLLFRAYREGVEQGKSVRVITAEGRITASPPSAEEGIVRLDNDILEYFRYGGSVTFILSEIVVTLRRLESRDNPYLPEVPVQDEDDGMLPEYDFSGSKGIRGKYGKISSENAIVRVIETDGSITLRPFDYEADIIYLSSDLQEYFPDSDTVNKTLRSLIALIPK